MVSVSTSLRAKSTFLKTMYEEIESVEDLMAALYDMHPAAPVRMDTGERELRIVSVGMDDDGFVVIQTGTA